VTLAGAPGPRGGNAMGGNESEFDFDVFLSHSSKDKAVVRDLAGRFKAAPVKQIEFRGEPLTAQTLMALRDRIVPPPSG
jgi:hypothetical protein